MVIQQIYQEAIKFAANKHAEINQKITGTNLPFVVHLSNVAMEIIFSYAHNPNFNIELTIKLALLHDTIEDTNTTKEELEALYGIEVAEGVEALTKNEQLPKTEQMKDSLERIKLLSKEVNIVKLADRITNLQKPPDTWSPEKMANYKLEAIQILTALKGSNAYLENRLKDCIEGYGN